MIRRTLLSGSLGLLAFGCTSSGTLPPVDAGVDAPIVVPTSASCTGDATLCLSGVMTTRLFTATYSAAKVEVYRVYPTGGAMPILSTPLAKDGTFAFSNLSPWGHYYLKGIVRFGDGTTGTSIATLSGRHAVPSTAQPIALVAIPAQLELLETTNKGASRQLQWVSAHLFDPNTGRELLDATVSVSGTRLPATPMPFTTNVSGQKSYFVTFSPTLADTAAIQILASHPAFGATSPTFSLAAEASSFDEPPIASPANAATIAVNQPLDVTWSSEPRADYAVVAFFKRQGAQFVSRYATPAPIASDATKETVPGSAVSDPGAYLLNVNTAQTACGKSDGCTTLFHAASASVTAQ